MTAARQFGALLAAAAVVAAGFAAMGRAGHHGQAGVDAAPEPPAAVRDTADDQPPKPSGVPEPAASGADESAADIGDILEPMAAQLADLLAHLREDCPPAGRAADAPDLSAAARCVAAAEATASTVDFVRGTLASAAGGDLSDAVRSRWTRGLDADTVEIRASLMPIQKSVGRTLASGAPSPAAFRDLGHLRDRMDRLLADLK
jgi:hypothetical protein